MKLGIAGNGVIVQEVLSFIDEIGFEEICICGRKQSMEKLQALAKQYKLSTVYTDYDQMLSSDIDVVYIGVLNDLHVEYTKKALEAGKHVICEKPMTITAAELQELEALAKDNQVMLFEAMSIYHMPAYKQLQKDVKLAGDLKICNFNYSQMSRRYKAFHEGTSTPAVFDAAHNGGALRDLNVYNISAMVGLFGKPKNVSYTPNMEKDVDTSGILVADYGEFKCLCTAAKDCAAPGPATIQGVDATICIYPHVNGMTEYDVLFNDADTDTKEVDMGDGSHRLFFEFKEFKRIIEEKDVKTQEQIMQYSKWVAEIIDQATA
ncbi:Predicted dehydrogenase [Pseudobutyrivibrio sp. YE44]|uniref:Gfo/Idh/MocA family protein n=1 Tax=Pseudobutyrivibrio sp. YE44 TaxID=1520802 RepID=UPI0008851729|nr:Gfo/Idh/MocA family oxidoreductase [Pseudobutyrivibrio sp. YE44]SDB41255.1 Predicted dehydrogenase [Pseudobutyrivibrio sp. YE44]